MAGGLIPKADQQFFLLVASLSICSSHRFLQNYLHSSTDVCIFKPCPSIPEQIEDTLSDSPKVLIAGYGRVGRLLGATLEARGIPYVAIDNNFENVKKLRDQGHRVIYADSRKIDIWRHLHLDSVRANRDCH